MNYFSLNLKFLRKKKRLRQDEVLGFKRTQWANYEGGKSYPKFIDLIEIANFFDISETDLIHSNLSKEEKKTSNENTEYTIEIQKKLIEQLDIENKMLKEKLKQEGISPKKEAV
ncbi:helix-turn-helix transcriptional regulator [Tenacibaculum maritimum]|nr:helix-turn-helix transcriptional regulator [Tenacibaculum maritimum]